MNEEQAWQCFKQSGSVEDYLRYAGIRNSEREWRDAQEAGRDHQGYITRVSGARE